ncbi:hypothetical protein ACCQ13_16450 [Xanthomonas sp. NCPPB 1638]|uniref:hypothetical protein n=1 Tax=Xanthomonas TaxID=338 RepID=UPI002269B794|nr:hypothetical protein [Xanthomonas cucurbitae]
MPRWTFDADFLRLLASFERMLPLAEPSRLHDTALATRLFSLSEGYLGELATLLNQAATTAVEIGRERIDLKLLDGLGWVSPSERRRAAERMA